MVKNAVIVPVGSKGGFVVKQASRTDGREAFQAEGVACYQTFLRGMLDVTDNLKEGQVVHPANTVRYDGDDPYLVVAADKGTATFSDIANGVAAEYDFSSTMRLLRVVQWVMTTRRWASPLVGHGSQ